MIRIQRQRTPGWRMPEGAIYVGRPSVWGNPFLLTDVGRRFPSLTVEQCAGFVVNEFRDLVRAGTLTDSLPAHTPGQPREVRTVTYPPIDEIRAELAGHDLVCWCPLDQPCHADVLLELIGTCPECDGDGFVVETEETCCGDVLPSGECCAAIYGTARVRFEQVQQPCPGPGPHVGAAVV